MKKMIAAVTAKMAMMMKELSQKFDLCPVTRQHVSKALLSECEGTHEQNTEPQSGLHVIVYAKVLPSWNQIATI